MAAFGNKKYGRACFLCLFQPEKLLEDIAGGRMITLLQIWCQFQELTVEELTFLIFFFATKHLRPFRVKNLSASLF